MRIVILDGVCFDKATFTNFSTFEFKRLCATLCISCNLLSDYVLKDLVDFVKLFVNKIRCDLMVCACTSAWSYDTPSVDWCDCCK